MKLAPPPVNELEDEYHSQHSDHRCVRHQLPRLHTMRETQSEDPHIHLLQPSSGNAQSMF